MIGWLLVLIAALFEIIGVYGLNLFSKRRSIINGSIYFGGLGGSFLFLSLAFSYLQISIAYAVFIGIGTAGAVIMNMLFFGESKNRYRIISLAAIIIGVVGLKAVS